MLSMLLAQIENLRITLDRLLKLRAFVVFDINVGKQAVLSFEFKIMALITYWQNLRN